ncbi:MAG: heat-inducible transcriptional repressor HrcA [Oscillospiraceae bacterium]|nr:heat-inducible transcriptional repressor HrcA [Oscillospiraceae bacterium]
MTSHRKQRILAAVVELYNETGEPVGSKRLMELLPDDVSSATIRNEMAQLAEAGYLEQPHTSAGRIPSPQGYRYYIDHLLPQRELLPEERVRLESQLRDRAREPERLLENAGKLLAELTACAALCVPAAGVEVRVKRVEIAPLSRTMAMLALQASNGAVKSRVVRCECELTPAVLDMFTNIVREHMLGRRLDAFTQAGVQSLVAMAGVHLLAVAPLLICAAELADEAATREVVVGQHHLPPQLNVQQITKHAATLSPSQVTVLLGGEGLLQPGTTLLVSPYAIGGDVGGVLGVVGPQRMDYAKIIPGLQFIAALLGDMLTGGLDE